MKLCVRAHGIDKPNFFFATKSRPIVAFRAAAHAWCNWNWRRNAVPLSAKSSDDGNDVADPQGAVVVRREVSRSSADALFDLHAAFLTAHVATPVELAVAPLDHRSPHGVVAPAATHQLATVGRVGGRRAIARPAAGPERSGSRVLLAEVRRGAEVDEVGVGRLPEPGRSSDQLATRPAAALFDLDRRVESLA